MMDAGKLNGVIKSDTAVGIQEIKTEFGRLNIQHRDNSPSAKAAENSLAPKYKVVFGLISTVSISFPRHMVFVYKGVGKGVPISAAGSAGTSRKPKDWFTNPVNNLVSKLADDVADEGADMIINSIFIK